MWNIIIDNIWDPLFSYDFMRRALVSLFILSLSAPVAGVFLSLRKLSLSGDALSHAILPGAATGYLLKGLSVTAMTIGGILAGTLVIFMSALFSRLSRNTEDSSLAVFYLVSLALGVLIISLSGSGVDLMSFLFGSVFTISGDTVIFLGINAVITLLIMAVILRPLIIDSVDPLYLASVSRCGPWVHFAFMFAVVMNLVAGFEAIGTLMAVGMMVIPGISARFWSFRLGTIILLSIVIATLSSLSGLLLSFHLNIPGGPSVILILGGVYLLSFLFGFRNGLLFKIFSPKHYES